MEFSENIKRRELIQFRITINREKTWTRRIQVIIISLIKKLLFFNVRKNLCGSISSINFEFFFIFSNLEVLFPEEKH